MRTSALLLASVGVAALGACSLFTSLDDLDDGNATPNPSAEGGAITPNDDGGAPNDSGTTSEDGGDSGTRASRYRAAVLEDSPLIYLRFGEPVNSLKAVSEVNPDVVSGFYPAVGVKWGVPGALAEDDNTAIELSGGFITMPALSSVEFTGDAPFSIELWIKIEAVQPGYQFIVDHQTWTAGRFGWDLLLSDSAVIIERVKAGVFSSAASNGPLTPSVWHHVLATFDGLAQRMFIDGVETQQTGSAHSLTTPLNDTWTIGGNNCKTCSERQTVKGTIDEVAIYNKALPLERLSAHIFASRSTK